MLEVLRAKVPHDELSAEIDRAGENLADPRVRAIFQVAPGWGSFLTPASLARVRIPVEIRWGGADTIAPYDDLKPYLTHIPTAHGRSGGRHVRHKDFFAPDAANATIRNEVGGDVATFFLHHLT